MRVSRHFLQCRFCNELDIETFRRLEEDIKTNNLRYPILVRQTGPKRYEIIDGEHRWKAAKELGWHEIEAQVVEMDEGEAEVANYKLNSARGNTNPVKVAMLFDIEKRRGLSEAKIRPKPAEGLAIPRDPDLSRVDPAPAY